MTLAADSLGSKLKAERESRGFTLDDVSASTKIPVTLLEALERDDLSRWPKGLYRRAFFRSYLTALGLRPEPLAGEFARLFPDEPSLEPPPAVFAAASLHADSNSEPLALTLAGPAAERVRRSLAIPLVEVAAVLAAGGLLGWAAGMTLLTASGAVALVYYPFVRAATARARRSPDVADRAEASTAPPPPPTPGTDAGERAPADLGESARQRIRSGLATARLQLAQLRAHAGRKWLSLAERITRTANHGLRRAGTQTERTLSHVAEATFHVSSRFVTRTRLLLGQAGTRTGRVLRRGAAATVHVSSRFVTWAKPLLWRAGTRTGRFLRRGAAATVHVSSRFVTWTTLLLRRAGAGSRRKFQAAATHTSRVSLRVLRAVNHSFWTGVRAAAEHAELFAARRLDRKSE